ncbi:afsK [Symbiodinium sp. CCMP2456]|nr:afsK [Symbiodinium sp. CCMP2456]
MASLCSFMRLSGLCAFLGFLGLVEASTPEASECESPRAVELLQLDSALQFRGQTELSAVNSAQNSTSTASSSYWYPVRGVDAGRSGYCPGAVGPFPLPAPAWSLEVPGLNFHQTPVIDDVLNIYTTSDNGTILSFSKDGQKRWEFQPKSIRCQNPSLFDGKLYTACANGQVVALRMDTGEEVWSRPVFDGLPTDAYTVSATEDFLVIPMADTGLDFGGAWGVALLDRADGRLRWSYNVSTIAPKSYVINLDPCILNESIILSDTSGGVYRLSVEDGSEIWRVPGLDEGTFTLGGVACAGDMVFNGYSRADGSGGLRALRMESGSLAWNRAFPKVVHNAPAIGRIYNHGESPAVIVGMGEPPGRPWPLPANITGKVVAVDAVSNQVIWTFEPPPWHHWGAAGSTFEQLCFPDLFSAATIDADGTVYINWSAAGITYALRDANADGIISLQDPREVSAADLGSAATGPPALAPGMIFVNTCRRPSAFF